MFLFPDERTLEIGKLFWAMKCKMSFYRHLNFVSVSVRPDYVSMKLIGNQNHKRQ